LDRTNMTCPACGSKQMEWGTEDIDIPNFGKVSHYYLRCRDCGYKINDFAFTGNNPTRAEVKIEKKEDLFTKIARGNQARVSIPELGLNIYPGPVAETFVTNIEGLLERFLRVLPLFEDKERVKEKEDEIHRAMNGDVKFTVIIEDPSGVSHFIDGKDEPNISSL